MGLYFDVSIGAGNNEFEEFSQRFSLSKISSFHLVRNIVYYKLDELYPEIQYFTIRGHLGLFFLFETASVFRKYHGKVLWQKPEKWLTECN